MADDEEKKRRDEEQLHEANAPKIRNIYNFLYTIAGFMGEEAVFIEKNTYFKPGPYIPDIDQPFLLLTPKKQSIRQIQAQATEVDGEKIVNSFTIDRDEATDEATDEDKDEDKDEATDEARDEATDEAKPQSQAQASVKTLGITDKGEGDKAIYSSTQLNKQQQKRVMLYQPRELSRSLRNQVPFLKPDQYWLLDHKELQYTAQPSIVSVSHLVLGDVLRDEPRFMSCTVDDFIQSPAHSYLFAELVYYRMANSRSGNGKRYDKVVNFTRRQRQMQRLRKRLQALPRPPPAFYTVTDKWN